MVTRTACRCSAPLLYVVVLLVASGNVLCSPDWPMFLENPTHTPSARFQPTGPLSAAWHFECGGICGGPAVYAGTVYVASRDGYLYAVDEATGRRLWRTTISIPGTEEDDPEDLRVRFGPFPGEGVLATPAVDAKTVYVGGLNGTLVACDRNAGGRPLWSRSIGGQIESSPVVTSRSVVVGSRSGKIVCLQPTDGSVRWTVDCGRMVNSAPAVSAGRVVVGTVGGVIAIDEESGRVAWRLPDAAPTLPGGANPPASGPAWRRGSYEGPPPEARYDSSPCIFGDTVYIGRWDGTLVAIDLATGALRWDLRVSRLPIAASPAVANGLVYVATVTGMLVAIDPMTQSVLWHAQMRKQYDQPADAYASPVVCGPVVLVGTNGGAIQVHDARTGDSVSRIAGRYEYVHGTPAVTDNAIYLATETHGWAGSKGDVAKLVCAAAGATGAADPGPVSKREFVQRVCVLLGLVQPQEQPKSVTTQYGGWELTRQDDQYTQQRADEQKAYAAVQLLERAGLDVYAYQWASRTPLSRYELAAFYHKLLWAPNPMRAQLPAFELAQLGDAMDWPWWVKEMPPKVVGLGLLQAKDGRFCGKDAITGAELEASLQRVKELLPAPPQ
jgi:outer membrane protein assembly factor BamB